MNFAPLPRPSLCTVSLPRWARVSVRQMARPRPIPPNLEPIGACGALRRRAGAGPAPHPPEPRADRVVGLGERIEDLGEVLRIDPDAAVGDLDADAIAPVVRGEDDGSAVRRGAD